MPTLEDSLFPDPDEVPWPTYTVKQGPEGQTIDVIEDDVLKRALSEAFPLDLGDFADE
jgi:hypothetical protein